MINKISKLINNKSSKFLNFIFFLRYVFLIFFVAIVLFLNIPRFFDYSKKEKIIKSYLSENYGLIIKEMGDIKFYSFPVPYLKIKNLITSFGLEGDEMRVQKLQIYPKIFNVYNYENFSLRKIKIEKSDLELKFQNINIFNDKIFNLTKKIHFENIDIKIKDNNNKVIFLKNLDFRNYGFQRNEINGIVFDKRFKIKIKDDFKEINFKLLNTGVEAELKIIEKKKDFNFKGILKGKVLKSNFKLDFSFTPNFIQINDFYLRDKSLSVNSSGILEISPFFKLRLNTNINNINKNIFSNLNVEKLLKSKEFIKRFNSQNEIIFKSQKFSKNLIDDFNLKMNLAFGRLSLSKKVLISNTILNCKNSVNLLDEYPIIYFDCSINSPDKKKLLKKIGIKYNDKNETLNLITQGNLNILNKKINFDNIKANKTYVATSEDLKFFKRVFEETIFDKNFKEIFNLSKVRKFIFKIS